jgi:spermidine/putrescine transport system substrate-binding protein
MRNNRARVRSVEVLLAIVGVAGWLGLASSAAFAASELHVLNWQGWGTDEPWAIEYFEKAHSVKVVHDYITSFPEAFTKLKTNPGYYDVIDLSNPFAVQATDQGLLQSIDASKLKNFKDLFPDMRDSPQLNRDGKLYGVAWIWGGTSVAYDTDVFKEPPTSLQVLWDAKYAGKVCMRDDAEDAIRFAALAIGQNPDKPADMAAIREKLRALKPQIKVFWKSEDEWLKLVAAKECALSTIWTTSVEKAKDQKLPVSFFIPQEGALAVRDALSIPKNPQNPDTAYAFIDYMISPEFYAGWVKAGGAPVASNAAAIQRLPESSLTKTVLTTPDALKRLNLKGPLSDQQRQAYLELWQETKTYIAR